MDWKNMTTQAERFSFIRERLGLSRQDFAQALGIHPTVASLIETGGRDASKDILSRLATTYGVNLNWYLTGKGETSIPDHTDGDSIYVPHIQQEAAAGRGVEIEEYAESRMVAVPRSLLAGLRPELLCAVTVRGDSMIEKEIFDRDIVVYNTSDRSGETICVVSLAGQLLVKTVMIEGNMNRITLLSANKLYPPRVIERQDLSDLKIEGRVVACLHGMR
jgi:SOS-response transcriptional repressor LexA